MRYSGVCHFFPALKTHQSLISTMSTNNKKTMAFTFPTTSTIKWLRCVNWFYFVVIGNSTCELLNLKTQLRSTSFKEYCDFSIKSTISCKKSWDTVLIKEDVSVSDIFVFFYPSSPFQRCCGHKIYWKIQHTQHWKGERGIDRIHWKRGKSTDYS